MVVAPNLLVVTGLVVVAGLVVPNGKVTTSSLLGVEIPIFTLFVLLIRIASGTRSIGIKSGY